MNTIEQTAIGRHLLSRLMFAPRVDVPNLNARMQRHYLLARRPELESILPPHITRHPGAGEFFGKIQ